MLDAIIKMNNPQFWGLLRGACIAIGGFVAAFGVIAFTDVQVSAWVDKTIALLSAVTAFLAIVVPMMRGFTTRSNENLAKDAVVEAPKETTAELAATPTVTKIVMSTDTEARAIPQPNVVGPE